MIYAWTDPSGALIGFLDDRINEIHEGAIKLTAAQYARWLAAPAALRWKDGALVEAPAPDRPDRSVAQRVDAALAAGCQVVSASDPALDGTYGLDAETRADIMGELVLLLLGGMFSTGTGELLFPDVSGAPHRFTVDHFRAFAPAINQYAGALKAVRAAGKGALPAQPVHIP